MRPAPIYKRLMLLAAIGMVGAWICRCGLAAEPAGSIDSDCETCRTIGIRCVPGPRASLARLAKLGSASRHDLEAAAESADPEVRLRATDLLRQFKISDLWLPSMIEYHSHGEPAAEAIAAIRQQSGNHILMGDAYGNFENRSAAIDYEAGTSWQVIDDLCRSTGNHARLHYDSREPGMVLVAGSCGHFPTAYAGPLRGQIVSEARSFNEKLDFSEGTSQKSHAFEFGAFGVVGGPISFGGVSAAA